MQPRIFADRSVYCLQITEQSGKQPKPLLYFSLCFLGVQREKGNNAKTILAIFPQSVTNIPFQPLKVL